MTDRPLRILQVSTADRAGGAERSAWNLFEAYRARGHASWLAVGYKQGDDPDVSLIPRIYDQTPWRRYCRTLRERLEPYHEVPGVWRMRRWLDAWENPRREIEKRLGIEDFNYPGSHRLLHVASAETRYRPLSQPARQLFRPAYPSLAQPRCSCHC